MPQLTTPRSLPKKATAKTKKTSEVSLITKTRSKASRRSSASRPKSNAVRVAPDGVPWPPLPRISGRGNLTAKQIRRAVLTAMATSRGMEIKDLEDELQIPTRQRITKK